MRPAQVLQIHVMAMPTVARANVVQIALVRTMKYVLVAFVNVVPTLRVKLHQTRAMEPIVSAEFPRHVLQMT